MVKKADKAGRKKALALYAELRSIRGVARALGIPRSNVQMWVQQSVESEPPEFLGAINALDPRKLPLPAKGKVNIFILTSAQNNTHIHEGFTNNLGALAAHLSKRKDVDEVELWASRFTYNKNKFSKKSVKPDKHPTREDLSDIWFDHWVEAHANDEYIELAPGLLWCGHMNILPTATRPLSGMDTYGGRDSTIFPHTKIAMQSVPTMRSQGTKLQYTTGSATLRNYLQKKAGIKAEFHHAYGATLVEVDDNGTWFVRQINGEDDGTFYELDLKVKGGIVTSGHRPLAINWGDIHLEIADEEPMEVAFGEGGMLDTLQPEHQFMHDLLDFRRRNHHDRGNPHLNFEKYVSGHECVEAEFKNVNAFLLGRGTRDWVKTYVVDSNHDRAFTRWLHEVDYRFDPVNAVFFLTWQLHAYRSIQKGEKTCLFEDAVKSYGGVDDVVFLDPDESMVLADIEFGMHGDLGPNGSRGSAMNLYKIGRRCNIGHSHSAAIVDGLYQSGVMALQPGYAKGPSSWSYSHIITYPNGKRTLVTFWEGKWRA